MLLSFTAANYLSVRAEQTLTLAASKFKGEGGYTIRNQAVPGLSILPAALIYGANASGKSSFLAALGYMREKILFSHNRDTPTGGTGRVAFALSKASEDKPSKFVIDFILKGVRYNYGFEVDDKIYLSEWLYAFPNNKQQILFQRQKTEIDPKRGLKGRNKDIAKLTRPNSLYLSAGAQNGHPLFTDIVDYFGSFHGDQRSWIDDDSASEVAELEMDQRVLGFLQEVGTGISEIRIKENKLSKKGLALQEEVSAAFKRVYGEEGRDFALPPSRKMVELGHKNREGKSVFLPFNVESSGTKRLLTLIAPAFRALDEGSLIVIDEISNSLHTRACEVLLALFCSPETNPRGAQIIGATHDTNLLQSEFLRRDQVWFAEKDVVGETHIYPLTDIRTRKGDDLGRGYLQGRYGAIPYSGSVGRFVKSKK